MKISLVDHNNALAVLRKDGEYKIFHFDEELSNEINEFVHYRSVKEGSGYNHGGNEVYIKNACKYLEKSLGVYPAKEPAN